MADEQIDYAAAAERARKKKTDAATTDETPKVDYAAAAERARGMKKPPPVADAGKGSYADVLPAVGGAIGGLAARLTPVRAAGTAGGVTLAGIGGAAGEGYKQLIKN